jgi:hypothetical protein
MLDWYIGPETSGQKKDLVQALGLITAGVAGALGIYMTWRGQRQARDAQEDNQRNTLAQLENAREQLELARGSQEDNQRNTQQQLDIAQQGQITERFTKAIEQLSATSNERKNLEMRLGGIHALERISRESENDYWPIMEILSAYVREHASQEPAADVDLDKRASEADLDREASELEVLESLSFGHAEADIQAILDTIGRRSRTWPREEPARIRLERTDLRGAQFIGANLSGVWLLGADLRGAVFRGGGLNGTTFTRANLRNTVFQDVNLQEVGGLDQDQIEQAFGYGTELPVHLSKPPHWDRGSSGPA